MSLRSRIGDVYRAAVCACHRRALSIGDHGPIVSFTFDDFPRSASETGASILERFDARGTYYAALGLANTTTELGDLLHTEDVLALLEKGHEIGSQTFSHLSCRAVSLSRYREDVCRGRKAVEEVIAGPAGNFSYPFGHMSIGSKKTLAPYLTSCRSIYPGFNGPDVDLNLLRANRLYGGTAQIRQVEDLIAENARRKTWLIFYTHDVRPNPSIYGCEPELLQSAVSAATHSRSRILTVQQALLEFGIAIDAMETLTCRTVPVG